MATTKLGRQRCLEIMGMQDGDHSEEDFKKVYRRMALTLHPDKNEAPNATEQFQLLYRAYKELTDPHLDHEDEADFGGGGFDAAFFFFDFFMRSFGGMEGYDDDDGYYEDDYDYDPDDEHYDDDIDDFHDHYDHLHHDDPHILGEGDGGACSSGTSHNTHAQEKHSTWCPHHGTHHSHGGPPPVYGGGGSYGSAYDFNPEYEEWYARKQERRQQRKAEKLEKEDAEYRARRERARVRFEERQRLNARRKKAREAQKAEEQRKLDEKRKEEEAKARELEKAAAEKAAKEEAERAARKHSKEQAKQRKKCDKRLRAALPGRADADYTELAAKMDLPSLLALVKTAKGCVDGDAERGHAALDSALEALGLTPGPRVSVAARGKSEAEKRMEREAAEQAAEKRRKAAQRAAEQRERERKAARDAEVQRQVERQKRIDEENRRKKEAAMEAEKQRQRRKQRKQAKANEEAARAERERKAEALREQQERKARKEAEVARRREERELEQQRKLLEHYERLHAEKRRLEGLKHQQSKPQQQPTPQQRQHLKQATQTKSSTARGNQAPSPQQQPQSQASTLSARQPVQVAQSQTLSDPVAKTAAAQVSHQRQQQQQEQQQRQRRQQQRSHQLHQQEHHHHQQQQQPLQPALPANVINPYSQPPAHVPPQPASAAVSMQEVQQLYGVPPPQPRELFDAAWGEMPSAPQPALHSPQLQPRHQAQVQQQQRTAPDSAYGGLFQAPEQQQQQQQQKQEPVWGSNWQPLSPERKEQRHLQQPLPVLNQRNSMWASNSSGHSRNSSNNNRTGGSPRISGSSSSNGNRVGEPAGFEGGWGAPYYPETRQQHQQQQQQQHQEPQHQLPHHHIQQQQQQQQQQQHRGLFQEPSLGGMHLNGERLMGVDRPLANGVQPSGGTLDKGGFSGGLLVGGLTNGLGQMSLQDPSRRFSNFSPQLHPALPQQQQQLLSDQQPGQEKQKKPLHREQLHLGGTIPHGVGSVAVSVGGGDGGFSNFGLAGLSGGALAGSGLGSGLGDLPPGGTSSDGSPSPGHFFGSLSGGLAVGMPQSQLKGEPKRAPPGFV